MIYRFLHQGAVGKDVRELQWAVRTRLRIRGEHPYLAIDGELGPQTLAAARRAGYLLGAHSATLKRRGVTVGLQRMLRDPQRRTAAQLRRARERKRKDANTLGERALKHAERAIGIVEKGGNNRGPEVEAIIRANGGEPGEPWCGDFVAYCYLKAGSKSVVRAWAAVRFMLTRGVVKTKRPRPGDIVRFNFDHTGLFVRDLGDGRIETIEGNTGDSGAASDSRTGGDGVKRKYRSKSLVSDYLHVQR